MAELIARMLTLLVIGIVTMHSMNIARHAWSAWLRAALRQPAICMHGPMRTAREPHSAARHAPPMQAVIVSRQRFTKI